MYYEVVIFSFYSIFLLSQMIRSSNTKFWPIPTKRPSLDQILVSIVRNIFKNAIAFKAQQNWTVLTIGVLISWVGCSRGSLPVIWVVSDASLLSALGVIVFMLSMMRQFWNISSYKSGHRSVCLHSLDSCLCRRVRSRILL